MRRNSNAEAALTLASSGIAETAAPFMSRCRKRPSNHRLRSASLTFADRVEVGNGGTPSLISTTSTSLAVPVEAGIAFSNNVGAAFGTTAC